MTSSGVNLFFCTRQGGKCGGGALEDFPLQKK